MSKRTTIEMMRRTTQLGNEAWAARKAFNEAQMAELSAFEILKRSVECMHAYEELVYALDELLLRVTGAEAELKGGAE